MEHKKSLKVSARWNSVEISISDQTDQFSGSVNVFFLPGIDHRVNSEPKKTSPLKTSLKLMQLPHLCFYFNEISFLD